MEAKKPTTKATKKPSKSTPTPKTTTKTSAKIATKTNESESNTLILAAMDLAQDITPSKNASKADSVKSQPQSPQQSIEIESLLESNASLQVIYLDKQNSQKTLQKTKKFLESKGKVVYMGEVRYGLDPRDFIYELRLL